MTTVVPANRTARPEVVREVAGRPRVPSLEDALPVPGDDEQRVVDADTDADHGGHLGEKFGTVRTWVKSSSRPTPMPRPASAVMTGRPMATTEPKASSKLKTRQ